MRDQAVEVVDRDLRHEIGFGEAKINRYAAAPLLIIFLSPARRRRKPQMGQKWNSSAWPRA